MGDTPNLWWFWPQFCGDFDWEIMIIIGTGGYPVFRQAHLVMPLSVWHPDRVSKGSGRFGRFGRIEKEELRRFKLLKDVKVKVLLVTLELDQHWLHAQKKIGAGAWTLMSAARRKLGRRVEGGVGAKFWAPRKHRLELNTFLGTLHLHKLGWLIISNNYSWGKERCRQCRLWKMNLEQESVQFAARM